MNNTAPIWMGVATIAGLVFIVGTGVALVMFDFPLVSAVFVGAVVAGGAAVALAIGWAPPRNDAPVNKPIAADTVADAALVPTPVAVATPAATPVEAATPAPAQVEAAPPAPVATPDPVAVAPKPGIAIAPEQPVFLTAARDTGPDNLKLLKGVGPKLETTLHGLGIFHFDQIAAWTPAEQAWMDDNLEGFKGRVTRDDWVGQARALSAGGTA
ncbi:MULTISPECIES: NADH:ubiquinone oxidoreductase [unclassified Yoonia]|uniref:NADH:ubiquinone oxidoreductase n=1 Tax=unclassified Yoonia TaxID=2629118 RepID=UPI002AFE3519|nr:MULTISPECIES: NADH:ubiquinone oxidoreductase [unclassified Yoonia]